MLVISHNSLFDNRIKSSEASNMKLGFHHIILLIYFHVTKKMTVKTIQRVDFTNITVLYNYCTNSCVDMIFREDKYEIVLKEDY